MFIINEYKTYKSAKGDLSLENYSNKCDTLVGNARSIGQDKILFFQNLSFQIPSQNIFFSFYELFKSFNKV